MNPKRQSNLPCSSVAPPARADTIIVNSSPGATPKTGQIPDAIALGGIIGQVNN